MTDTSTQFTGSIPEMYHRHLGPVLFEPYATDMADRLSIPDEGRILELASGTGILTRRILEKMPRNASLLASDLNEAMIAVAKNFVPADDRVSWRPIDAMSIPHPDHSFDHVVCQFGLMFFPDKLAASREVRRVLDPGGSFLFSVWDSLDHNDLFRTTQDLVLERFPDDPPTFYTVPFHYHRPGEITAMLSDAGFRRIEVTHVPLSCRSRSARDVARGIVLGNPIVLELAARAADANAVLETLTERLADRYGREPLECRMRALVVEAR